MNYREIRQLFLNLSGRTDLVDEETLADTGAGFYINAGQRWLDLHFGGKQSLGRYFQGYEAGTYTINIPACRVIEEVWMYDDTAKWQLTKKDLNWLRKNYASAWKTLDRGKPRYYHPTVLRLFQDTSERGSNSSSFNVNQANLMTGASFGYDALVILPPFDSFYSIELWGKFHSAVLDNDKDSSWWSERYPEALIYSALRQVEIAHRNTQGVNDWTGVLVEMLGTIDQDQADEESTTINQMNG